MSYSRDTEFKQEYKDVKDNVNEKKITQVIKSITTSELQQILEIYDAEKGFFTKLFGYDGCKGFRNSINLFLPNKETDRELTLQEASYYKTWLEVLRKRELGSKTIQFIDELNKKYKVFWYVINTIFFYTLSDEKLLQNDENLNKILQAKDVYKVKEVIELFKETKILSQATFNIACEIGDDPIQITNITKLFDYAQSTKQFDLVLNNLKEVCRYADVINYIFSILKNYDGLNVKYDSVILKNADFAEQIYAELIESSNKIAKISNYFQQSEGLLDIENLFSNLNKLTPKLRERIFTYPSCYTKAIIRGILCPLRTSDPYCSDIRIEAIFKAPQNTEAIIALLESIHFNEKSFLSQRELLLEHAEHADEINKAANELSRIGILTPDNLKQLFEKAKCAVKITSLISKLPKLDYDIDFSIRQKDCIKHQKLFNSIIQNHAHLNSIEKELKIISANKINITSEILQNIIDNLDALQFKYFLQGKHPRCEKSNVFKFFGKNSNGTRNHVHGSDKPLAIIQSFLNNVKDQKEMQLEKKQTLSN